MHTGDVIMSSKPIGRK